MINKSFHINYQRTYISVSSLIIREIKKYGRYVVKLLLIILCLLSGVGAVTAQNNLIVNGIPWFDDKGSIVNAHMPVWWKKTEDIIFSANGNRTKVTLSRDSRVIPRMTS